MRGMTDRKVGFEFKDWNLIFLNQPTSFIPFLIKIHLLKPKWKNINIKQKKDALDKSSISWASFIISIIVNLSEYFKNA